MIKSLFEHVIYLAYLVVATFLLLAIVGVTSWAVMPWIIATLVLLAVNTWIATAKLMRRERENEHARAVREARQAYLARDRWNGQGGSHE